MNKKLLRVDQLTRKNIYMLSSLGNRKLGKASTSIRINYNELQHQDLLIKWVSSQKDIVSYQTEKELKSESPIKRISWFTSSLWKQRYEITEFERTRKTIKRFEDKLDGLRQYLKQNIHIMWLVPNQNMKIFIDNQIKAYNWKIEQHHIEIFNGNV